MFSRSLDDYMKIMKKRFDGMKKIVFDRTNDQSVQPMRQSRIFPRNHTFAASLQTQSKKFKEDWIGPLQVKFV